MDSFKFKVSEVHEYFAWVSAPDEDTALELLQDGVEDAYDTVTIRLDVEEMESLGRVGIEDFEKAEEAASWAEHLAFMAAVHTVMPLPEDMLDDLPPEQRKAEEAKNFATFERRLANLGNSRFFPRSRYGSRSASAPRSNSSEDGDPA
jgi:hypothetical protein